MTDDPTPPHPQSESAIRLNFLELHRREYARQLVALLVARVLVALLCLAILLVYEEGSPRLFLPAYATLVCYLGVVSVQLAWYRRTQHLERLAWGCVVLDLCVENLLAYLTGGIYNVGFGFLHFASILSAAILISEGAAYLVASGATVGLALIAVAYRVAIYMGWTLPLVPEEVVGQTELRWGQISANLIGVGVAYHGVAFLGNRLPHRVSRVGILYDEILERMREGVLSIDRRGQIVLVNTEACRLLNWGRPHLLVGRRFDQVLRRVEDRPLLAVLTRGQDSHVELQLRVRDRPPFPLEVITSVLHDARGGVRGVVAIFRDLTTLRLLGDMEGRLARLAGTEEVAMGLAHEIRTPLASIRGAVQELATHALEDPSDLRLAQIVRRESERLDRIIQEFLDFARMRPPLRHPVDLVALLEEATVLLAQHQQAQEVEIRFDPPDRDYLILGDPDQLGQVFSNLGANALEAMAGSGVLEVSMGEYTVPQRGEGPAREVESLQAVEVSFDNDGPALPPDAYGKIFNPFYTTKKSGLGLGLAIVEKIVGAHEGHIACDGGSLGGTRFRLSFPLVRADGARGEG